MIATLNKELFWKNLDTSLLLAQALKTALSDELSLKHAYQVLTQTMPQLTQEGLAVLESVFVDSGVPDEDESEPIEDDENDKQDNIVKQHLI